jgi:hypothetical protein
MLLRKDYNTLLSSKLDNAELGILTVLYCTQTHYYIFNTSFGILGMLDGRNRKIQRLVARK